jgi:CRP/FNR family transcriptional regulator, cyclic AMP receptor protein
MDTRAEEIRDMLEDIGLIKDLDPNLQEKLIRNMKVETYAPGALVFDEKDPGDRIFIVETGQIAIKKSIDWAKGTELVIDYCDRGDFFGEMAVFESATRSARAEAAEETRLLVIDGKAFLGLMQENPETFTILLFSMIRILSNRLRVTHMKLITIYEIGNILTGQIPKGQIAARILETLLASLEMKKGALLIYNPFNELMEFGALQGITPVRPDLAGVPLIGVLKQIMDRGECAVVDGTFIDDHIRHMVGTDHPPAWLLAAPMKIDDNPIGFLILIKQEEFAPFHKGEVLLLSSVAKLIALEILHARMREETNAREKFKRVYFKDVM